MISSCVIYHRDPESGAEHIWGVGHLATKVISSKDGKQAVVSRATLTGVAVGIDDGSISLSAGWDRRERITVYDENTSIVIRRPAGDDFFLFRIGSSREFENTVDEKNR